MYAWFFLGCSRIATFGKAHGCTAKTEKGEKCKPNRRWPQMNVFFGLVWISPKTRRIICALCNLRPVEEMQLHKTDKVQGKMTSHVQPSNKVQGKMTSHVQPSNTIVNVQLLMLPGTE
jgi:hypothetical protein